MNKKIKAASVAAFLIMLINVFSLSAFAAGQEEYIVYEDYKQYETYSSNQTLGKIVNTDSLKNVLRKGLYNCDANIDISSFNIAYTDDNVDALMSFVYEEMPENFHLSTRMRFSCSSNNTITKLIPSYYYTASEYQLMYSEVENAVDKMLCDIKGNSYLTDVEKALLIHDRLALICEYDYVDSFNQYDMYGALINGSAVCQGYAEAYDYLLEKVGIESYICTSDQLFHAWNIVFVGGKPYHVDVTWDDYSWGQGERGAVGIVCHDNFLRSSVGIYSTGHEATDYDTFPNDTTFDNYVWQNSITAFQMVDNELYYIDNVSKKLKRYRDDKTLCNIDASWQSSHGVWGNFSCLASDGKNLYYSTPNTVYKYDFSTQTSKTEFSLNLTNYNNIYGFQYLNGRFICDINDTPPYSSFGIDNLYQISKVIEHTHEYDNVCDADCNICLEKRSVPDHIYDNACDTNCNICKSNREVPDHIYDNRCDSDCNICKAKRNTTHTYYNACDNNCNYCGYVRDVPGHSYSSVVDRTCDICLSVRTVTYTGWLVEDGSWVYYKSGTKLKNAWMQDSKGWTYLGSNGKMVVANWVYDNGAWYYMNSSGYMVSNQWMQDSKGWCYLASNGKMIKSSWIQDGGAWYYLNANGYMVSNQWMQDSKGWCYLTASGKMATNAWIRDSKGWCYVGANGYCVKNQWMKDSKGWVYLNSEGRMATNCWMRDSKGWCYLGADGYAVTNSWKRDSKGWCYLDANGRMVIGDWLYVGGKWYYLDANGYMVTGTKTIGGKTYKFNSNGVWVG